MTRALKGGYLGIVGELSLHVEESAKLALAGDTEAQGWLIATFPGNAVYLKRWWPTPQPQPQLIVNHKGQRTMSNTKIDEAERRLAQLQAHQKALAAHRPIVARRQETAVIEAEAILAAADLRGLPLPAAAPVGDSELMQLAADEAIVSDQIETLRIELDQLRQDERLQRLAQLQPEIAGVKKVVRESAITYLKAYHDCLRLVKQYNDLARQSHSHAYRSGEAPPVITKPPAKLREAWLDRCNLDVVVRFLEADE